MKCAYNNLNEKKKIYPKLIVDPWVGVLKIYSDTNNQERVDEIIDFLLKYMSQKKISLPEKTGFSIMEDDLLGTFAWKGDEIEDFTYLINKQDIQRINLPMKSKLVKDITKYEREGWKICLDSGKNFENVQRYLCDFYGGSE